MNLAKWRAKFYLFHTVVVALVSSERGKHGCQKGDPPQTQGPPPQTQDRVLSEGLGASLSKASQTDARCQPLRAPGVPGLEPGLVLAVPCGPVSLGSRRAEPEKKRPRLRNWTLRRTRLPASPRGHVPEHVPVTRLRARARRFLVTLQC